MEGKGLRVNLTMTKVMISDINIYFRKAVMWSLLWGCWLKVHHCAHWVKNHCSGLNGKLDNVFDFKCRACLNPNVTNDDDKKVRLGNVEYEAVDQFYYLGDMLSECGSAEASSIPRIKSGWEKFREFLSFWHLEYFCIRWKESYIQLVLKVSRCMAAKPGHWRKVTSTELHRRTNAMVDVPYQY